ncbi:MAG: zinc-binding metallopeptidase family protein [Pauljensenia sp.]
MKLFQCPRCQHIVYFDNDACVNCGVELSFSRAEHAMVALVDAVWTDGDGTPWRRCRNHAIGCNWACSGESDLCDACLLVRSIPDVVDEKVRGYLRDTGIAVRRLVHQLDDLGLPIVSHRDRPDGGLAFDLDASTDDKKVMIGHLNGVITIDITEAQDSHREALRALLDEQYRTMLGHFRHEIGHYYWQALVSPDEELLTEFRQIFGDERQDYGAALDAHYEQDGAGTPWQDSYISQYATTHPWEDFAETFAHFLHITDTLQTAAAHGIRMPSIPGDWPPEVAAAMVSLPRLDPLQDADMGQVLQRWMPLAAALNEVNRAMGKRDLYPFTIPDGVVGKLEYVLRLVRTCAATAPDGRGFTRAEPTSSRS